MSRAEALGRAEALRVVALLGACLGMAGWMRADDGPLATRLRQASPGAALYATIGGTEKKIADSAGKAWLVEGGRAVVYSGSDGAGGYENEGQSLWLYDAATGKQRKILAEYFAITGVEEARSKSGKTALLVTMVDGGLGATHVAAVDPDRGEVYRADRVRIVERGGGAIGIGWFRDEDWEKMEAKEKVRPFKTERLDIDELLRRPVMVNQRSQ